jgi:2-(1,2-epoxy-1,2-dihydrophenyl)acetyl-CoA isomerase
MAASDKLLVTLEGGIKRITINRPERRNALDAATARAVAEAIQTEGTSCRVLVLTGEGRAFCAGGDLDEIRRWSERSPGEVGETLYETFQETIRAIRATDAIVIAAIPGAAVGAGMDLALACDLRVASTSARLGQVWVRLGLIPGTGGAYLTQALVGPGRAADLLLTGRIVSASEALELGLVNRLAEPHQLMSETVDYAAQILAHPRDGVVANKRAYIAATQAGVEAALRHAAEVQPKRFLSEEFKRALPD